jgi:hypothetical protein
MVRFGGKNWPGRRVLTDPRIRGVLDRAEARRRARPEHARFALAVAAFDRIAPTTPHQRLPLSLRAERRRPRRASSSRARATARFVKLQDLRYG